MTLPGMVYGSGISKKQQLSFGGYDRRKGAYDGALWDEQNMGTDYYPLLSPRRKRKLVATLSSPGGLFGSDELIWIDGNKLYYGGEEKGTLASGVTGVRKIAQCGPYVCIWPDKKCFNTRAESDAIFDLEVTHTSAANSAKFHNGTIYGEEAEANSLTITGAAWENNGFHVGDAVTISGCTTHPDNNKTPVIREIDGDTLRFSELTFDIGKRTYQSGKSEITFTETAIVTTGEDFPFSAGTSVKISNSGINGNNKTAAITAVSQDKKTLTFASGTFTAGAESARLLIVSTVTEYTEPTAVTVAREVPDLDIVFEANGRLWGVYGSTIACCSLGLPWIWNDFEGLSDGCWAVDDYSPGDFTGGCAYLGYPTFFKEDRLTEVYGSRPANFQLNPSVTRGVAPGGGCSLAIAGDKLFYLGREGITVYGGGTPVVASSPFGDKRYTEAIGGTTIGDYYVSMYDGSAWAVFRYDTKNKLWSREDDKHIVAMAYAKDLYMLDSAGKLWAVDPVYATGTEEASLSWMAETGEFKEMTANMKGMIKLQLRLELAAGSQATLSISYDGGAYQPVQTITAAGHDTYYLAVVPRRCNRYSLKLAGTGQAWVYELTRETYGGSEK